MGLTLNLLAVFLYLLTALLLWKQTGRGAEHRGAGPRAKVALPWLAALACHAAGLAPVVMTGDGLNLAFFQAASLAALLLSLTLLVSCLRLPLELLGLVVLPLAAVVILFSHADPSRILVAGAAVPGIQAHILLSFLAYAFLSLAGIQAVAIYLQDRRLKVHGSPALLANLPPLDKMETFLFHLLGIGVVLLTLSLASGWLYHDDLMAQHLVHKTVLSAAAWLFFSALLVGRKLLGWRGRTMLRLVLTGVVLLALAYFGSKMVLELILHRV